MPQPMFPFPDCRQRLAMLAAVVLILVYGSGAPALAGPPAVKYKSFIVGQSATLVDPFTCWQTKLYGKALDEFGYVLVIRDTPLIRTAAQVESGNIDGMMSRSFNYGNVHPNLVRVEEPNCVMRFIAVTRIPDKEFNDIKALADSPYTIAYLRGDETTQKVLGKIAPDIRSFTVYTPLSGFRMLLADRIDIFIVPESIGIKLLNTTEFRDTDCRNAGPILATTTHAYLNKRHAKLAEKLSATLRAMKREGLPQQFARECGFEFYIPATAR